MLRKYAFSNHIVDKWNSLTLDCINCTIVNALKRHIQNSWNRKQNNVCVTLDSELYRREPVLIYAISNNVVGGVSEFRCFGLSHGCDAAKLQDSIRIRIGRPDSIESDGPIRKFPIAAPATFAVVP